MHQSEPQTKTPPKTKQPGLLSFLKNYKLLISVVVVLSLALNGLTLLMPKLNSWVIDSLRTESYNRDQALMLFVALSSAILILNLIQNVVSAITAEKIAAELRKQLASKISRQSFAFVNETTTSKLLTNLTADVDAVKQFINLGLVMAFAAVIQLIGSAILLLSINWQLALPILLTIPVLGVAFSVIFKSIEKYFTQGQEVIDRLNSVINESIIGSALVRVLNARKFEQVKFDAANQNARDVGQKIVNGWAALIPVINIVVNAAFLIVIGYGGVQVIDQTLTLGDFSAFFSYIWIFISPIIMIGFLAGQVGRAFATYTRINEVINSEIKHEGGEISKNLKGSIKLEKVILDLASKRILDNISFEVKPGSRVGIIGPTAAGKTQIFYLITGLIQPNEGKILVDNTPILDFNPDNLYSQMGMVFQDNVIFNTSIRENIAFRQQEISEEQIWKAIETAELKDFVDALPKGLDSIVNERGTSLSGGQKQRLSLARALALNPKILLLDDFTARVDINTERKIFANLKQNYPETTIVAITQKISSVMDFDNVVLVMEGELIASGTHEQLLKKSLEYQQIFNSQQRTEE